MTCDDDTGQELVEYKFDRLAVVTYTVTTAGGLDAARDASGELDTIADGGVYGWETNAPVADDVRYDIRCITVRGGAYLVEVDNELPDTGYEEIGDVPPHHWREDLQEALKTADKALGGDSNDDEHDALYDLREIIAGILGDTSEPPSPDEGDE